MSIKKRSRKLLLITTALTIASLGSVLFVYAAVTLGTFTGGNVTVTGVTTGTIEYNTAKTVDGWTTTLQPGSSWYAELLIGSSSTYHGPVTVTWQLQSYATGVWANDGSPLVTTGVSLAGELKPFTHQPTVNYRLPVTGPSRQHAWNLPNCRNSCFSSILILRLNQQLFLTHQPITGSGITE